MKRDLFNHGNLFENWKSELTDDYLEEGLTKENTKLFIQYLKDMEKGVNVSKVSKKGGRDPKTLNRLRSKVKQILKLLQQAGINDISKVKEKEIIDFFHKWNKTHSVDYAKRFKAFWHWWMSLNRKKGNLIPDITEDLSTIEDKGRSESSFVWLTKEEFDLYRKYFNEDFQTILLFCFDTIIRAPTELLSLKVENIYHKGEEVWIEIPNEISKTFGRKFNLVYGGKPILDYIKKSEKKPGDYLFDFSPGLFNQEMQRIAKQIFDERKSEGGELYKKITLYDLRHSGAIHFRQLFQKTGQSLDLLRERGGWTDFKMINYYTKRLGLDGHISKEKLLLEEDKTKLEKEVERVVKDNEKIKRLLKQVLDQGIPTLELQIPKNKKRNPI